MGKVWTSNSNPKLIARFYQEYFYKSKTIARMIRIDKGTETLDQVTMYAWLRQHHHDMDPQETVIYGPSTANQVSYVIMYSRHKGGRPFHCLQDINNC